MSAQPVLERVIQPPFNPTAYKSTGLIPDPRRGEIWLPEDGILVASHIPEQKLQGFEINPIVDSAIQGLGTVALRDVRFSGNRRKGEPQRAHRLYTMEVNGYNHATEVSDPLHRPPKYTILSFPGITEVIEHGFRSDVQIELSQAFPEARVVSVASNGIGTTGDRYGWGKRKDHSLEAMGSQRLAIARAFAGQQAVIIMGTSMGSVVTHHANHENTYGNPINGKVNVVGQFLVSQAIVPPENIGKDMIRQFLPELGLDVTKEILFKTNPWAILKLMARFHDYGISKADCFPIVNQLLCLFEGVPEVDFEDTVAAVPTLSLYGKNDCLAQHEMLDRIEEKHPHNLQQVVIPGRGHGLFMKPGKTCPKIARSSREFVDRLIA